jgi:hypothetical protein
VNAYRYVLKQRQKDGSVWTSPEVFEGDYHAVKQAVVAGFISGEARWAETSSDSLNPGFFLYGLNRFGKPVSSDPDFD